MYCIVKNCKSVWKPNSDVTYHSFPRNPIKSNSWLKNVEIKGKYYSSAKICSLHFKPEDYDTERPGRLLFNAVPFYSPHSCGCDANTATETNKEVELQLHSESPSVNTKTSENLLCHESKELSTPPQSRMNICRGCLSTNDNLTVLDALLVKNFNILTDLNIKWTDHTPWYMCDECLGAVNYCITFRDKCIATDAALKNILCPVSKVKEEGKSHDIEEICIKIEPEADSDDSVRYSPIFVAKREDEDEIPMKAKKRGRPRKEVLNDPPKFVCVEIPVNSGRPNREVSAGTETATDKKETVSKGEDLPKFNCGLCPEEYDSKELLLKHLEIHKVDNVCLLCHTTCLGYSHLLAHREQHIPPEQQKGCLFCDKSRLKAQNSLEFHYIKVHNLNEKNESFCCKLCFRKYETPRKLTKHMNNGHSELKFTCNICEMQFRKQHHLKKHMIRHQEETPFQCDLCEYKTKYLTNMKIHISRRHTNDKEVCRPCGRLFVNKELLDKHRPICPNSKTYCICPICGISISKNSRHMETHSDEHKYKCERCPATFKTKGALVIHTDRHDGIRRFQCEYCPMSFYSGTTLVKHRRKHTGEKPYVCHLCGKAYTINHNLKLHMKVHDIEVVIVKKNSLSENDRE